jgi:hypothetical protein
VCHMGRCCSAWSDDSSEAEVASLLFPHVLIPRSLYATINPQHTANLINESSRFRFFHSSAPSAVPLFCVQNEVPP